MAVEKKIFLGGLDRDSDLRFVKPEDYRDAGLAFQKIPAIGNQHGRYGRI